MEEKYFSFLNAAENAYFEDLLKELLEFQLNSNTISNSNTQTFLEYIDEPKDDESKVEDSQVDDESYKGFMQKRKECYEEVAKAGAKLRELRDLLPHQGLSDAEREEFNSSDEFIEFYSALQYCIDQFESFPGSDQALSNYYEYHAMEAPIEGHSYEIPTIFGADGVAFLPIEFEYL